MTTERAYGLLEVKALDEDRREIRGTASTPSPDRSADIVDPLGATFAPEIPLLWQHSTHMAVGTAKLSRPTKKGIDFVATFPLITEPGQLRDMVELAWQSVKARLVRGVSIGFIPKAFDYMSEGGVRFREYEIYELSVVTIPANAEATIQSIKALSARADAGRPVRLLSASSPVRENLKGAVRLVRPF